MILGSVKYALQWIADALLFVNNSLGLAGGRLPKADRNRYASCAALYWLGTAMAGFPLELYNSIGISCWIGTCSRCLQVSLVLLSNHPS